MKTYTLLAGAAAALLLTTPAFAQLIGGGAGQVGAAGAAPGSVPLDAPAVPGVPRNLDTGPTTVTPSDRQSILAGAAAAQGGDVDYVRTGAAAAQHGPDHYSYAKPKMRPHVVAHRSSRGRVHVPLPKRRSSRSAG